MNRKRNKNENKPKEKVQKKTGTQIKKVVKSHQNVTINIKFNTKKNDLKTNEKTPIKKNKNCNYKKSPNIFTVDNDNFDKEFKNISSRFEKMDLSNKKHTFNNN